MWNLYPSLFSISLNRPRITMEKWFSLLFIPFIPSVFLSSNPYPFPSSIINRLFGHFPLQFLFIPLFILHRTSLYYVSISIVTLFHSLTHCNSTLSPFFFLLRYSFFPYDILFLFFIEFIRRERFHPFSSLFDSNGREGSISSFIRRIENWMNTKIVRLSKWTGSLSFSKHSMISLSIFPSWSHSTLLNSSYQLNYSIEHFHSIAIPDKNS